MNLQKEILDRAVNIRSAINGLGQLQSDAWRLRLLEDIFAETEALVKQRETTTEVGGSDLHPLGTAPFLTARILHNLDACEVLVYEVEKGRANTKKSGRIVDDIVYPFFWCTIVRSVASSLVSLRGRWKGYYARYDCPTFTEVAYIRCGMWLEPFFRRVLIKRKRPIARHPDT